MADSDVDRCCALAPNHEGDCGWKCSECYGTAMCIYCMGGCECDDVVQCEHCDGSEACPTCDNGWIYGD